MNRRNVLKAAVGFLGLGCLFRAKAPAEPCCCENMQQPTGMSVSITPVMSADGKYPCELDRWRYDSACVSMTIVGTATHLDGDWQVEDADTIRRRR